MDVRVTVHIESARHDQPVEVAFTDELNGRVRSDHDPVEAGITPEEEFRGGRVDYEIAGILRHVNDPAAPEAGVSRNIERRRSRDEYPRLTC